jgi:hypothetical protein
MDNAQVGYPAHLLQILPCCLLVATTQLKRAILGVVSTIRKEQAFSQLLTRTQPCENPRPLGLSHWQWQDMSSKLPI